MFRFFVDPVLVGRWLGSVRALDGRLGGELCVETALQGVVRGQLLVVSPPDSVAWTWEPEDRSVTPFLVDVELVDRNEGTLVQLTRRAYPATPSREDSRAPEAGRPSDDAAHLFWREALAKLYAAAVRSRRENS